MVMYIDWCNEKIITAKEFIDMIEKQTHEGYEERDDFCEFLNDFLCIGSDEIFDLDEDKKAGILRKYWQWLFDSNVENSDFEKVNIEEK